MRRVHLLSLATVAALVSIAARKPDDPKHENHYMVDAPVSGAGVSVAFVAAESQAEFIQLSAKFTNTTTDKLLVVSKEGGEFVLPQGTFPTVKGAIAGMFGTNMLIGPGDTKGNTFKAEGAGFHVDSANFKFSKIWSGSNTGTPVALPDFALPPAQNAFSSGPWACKITDHRQETDGTGGIFSCTYSGTGAGIVEPSRISVRAPNGQMFANLAKKAKREVVMPGDVAKFPVEVTMPVSVCDMQFSILQVVFNDALSEIALTEVVLPEWALKLDAVKTKEEN